MPLDHEVEIERGQTFPATRPNAKTFLVAVVVAAAIFLVYDWGAITGYLHSL